MGKEANTVYPFEQPYLDPLQRIPDMEIPLLPDSPDVRSGIGPGERVVFLEPETDGGWNLYFRHVITKLLVKHGKFACLQIPPVDDVLLCVHDQVVKCIFNLALRSTAKPHFFKLKEEFHDSQ